MPKCFLQKMLAQELGCKLVMDTVQRFLGRGPPEEWVPRHQIGAASIMSNGSNFKAIIIAFSYPPRGREREE